MLYVDGGKPMKIDLIHNKIVRETITEGFEQAVREGLASALSERYGESLSALQMYEDYLSCGFTAESVQYYPLTLVVDGAPTVQWICWQVNKVDFKDGVPFSYVGDQPLVIDIVADGDLPLGFADKLSGRAIFCEEGLINIRVEAAALAPTFLSGKYSQTFVDEMARQLTPAICAAMSIRGIENSAIELSLIFAPETYMEHTSENVTYRRLVMSDKTSAPRDFWIMWTRLDGATAYTVSDNVSADTIRFELGEDVPQKIREKEYRFLLRTGKDKYHNAMGRRNITEWREMVKRAIRRGEIEKIEESVKLSEQASDVSERFARLLGVPAAPVAEEPAQSRPDDDMLKLARQLLGLGDDESVAETAEEAPEIDEVPPFDIPEAVASDADDEPPFDMPVEIFDDATVTFAEEVTEDEDAADALEREISDIISDAEELLASFAAETDELLFGDEEAVEDEISPEEAPAEEETADEDELADDIDPTAEIYDEDDEQTLAELRALDPDDESGLLEDDDLDDIIETESEDTEPELAEPVAVSAEDAVARMRAEMEAQIRLEIEREARARAEAEMERLRLEQERLKAENERLLAEAERRRAELEAREAERRAELEARARLEERERERLAEAAKLAVEEQRRIAEERARVERERAEEERRLAEERYRAEEARRIEEARIAERERILREASAPVEQPEEAPTAPAPAAESTDNYHYTSKNVRLIFRKHVDPNVTARMQEIIKATVEYYGKENVSLRIRASIPDDTTVRLEFLRIPEEEMELLANIIKVLGNSGLGIAKAVVD